MRIYKLQQVFVLDIDDIKDYGEVMSAYQQGYAFLFDTTLEAYFLIVCNTEGKNNFSFHITIEEVEVDIIENDCYEGDLLDTSDNDFSITLTDSTEAIEEVDNTIEEIDNIIEGIDVAVQELEDSEEVNIDYRSLCVGKYFILEEDTTHEDENRPRDMIVRLDEHVSNNDYTSSEAITQYRRKCIDEAPRLRDKAYYKNTGYVACKPMDSNNAGEQIVMTADEFFEVGHEINGEMNDNGFIYIDRVYPEISRFNIFHITPDSLFPDLNDGIVRVIDRGDNTTLLTSDAINEYRKVAIDSAHTKSDAAKYLTCEYVSFVYMTNVTYYELAMTLEEFKSMATLVNADAENIIISDKKIDDHSLI